MEKRGMQLAISTLVLIILGILILIALVLAFTGSWSKFMDNIRGYSMSDVDSLNKICQAQCDMGNEFGFCCEERGLGKEKITCLDERLNIDCDINCSEVC